MPTPVGHALAGAIVAVYGRSSVPGRATTTAVLSFLAVAPDLDLALRFLDGVNHHRGVSHSVGAAMIVGATAEVLRRWGRIPLPSGSYCFAAWMSHVLLDWLGADSSPPRGLMALWPFSSEFFIAPVSIFWDVPRSFSRAAVSHNLLAIGIEILVLCPPLILLWRRAHRRSTTAGLRPEVS